MKREEEFNFLRNHPLMKRLSDGQINSLLGKFVEETYSTNQTIIEEGDTTTAVYLIFEGELSVLKWDEEHLGQALLAKLHQGDMFGESAFLEPSPRSSTIKAIKPTTVLKLTKEMISGPEMKDTLTRMYANIGVTNTKRLNNLSDLYIERLRQNERFSQIWRTLGQFLLYQYIALSLSTSTAILFPKPIQPYVLWFVAAIFGIIGIRTIKLKGYRWSHFGFNLQGGFGAILVALAVVALSILVSCTAIWLLPLGFSPGELFKGVPPSALSTSLAANLLIYAAYGFFQEFVARGVLQTALQDFFQDKRGYKTVFVNACFLFILLLPFGIFTAFQTFLLSLPMGFIFVKQKTLSGVFLIHYLFLCLGLL